MSNSAGDASLKCIQPRRRGGFTLVELLVVVTIIGILAAMLLPLLNKGEIRAQGIQCVSNLKEMALGWQLYAEDNLSLYPINGSTVAAVGSKVPGTPAPVGEDLSNPSWVAGVMRLVASSDNTNASLLVGAAYAAFSSIGVYTKNPGIYHCPGDPSHDLSTRLPRVRSISMNGWIHPGKTNTAATYWAKPYQKFAKSTDFNRVSPADIFVFLDENQTLNDGWFYGSISGYNPNGSVDESQLDLNDIPATYHNLCGAFSFADGHAELHRWQGGPNFNNADLAWVMTHATIPQ